jgi:hypothetical protein
MKQRTTSQACCILFSVAIAIAPVVHAAGDGSLQMAKAIGEDASPPATAPKDKEAPPKKPATDTATTQGVADSEPLSPAARIGLIIAGVLVLAGGGGGGGGGSPTTSE